MSARVTTTDGISRALTTIHASWARRDTVWLLLPRLFAAGLNPH